MIFEYGTKNNKIDVTDIIYKNIMKDDKITIPHNDLSRKKLFKIDPCPNKVKSVYINDKEYNDSLEIIIHNNIITINEPYKEKLYKIHNELKFEGNIKDELPEQLLSVQYINPNSKILEIGSNIGRNSCIIAKLLKDSSNLTTIETIKKSIEILTKNKNQNNLRFNIIEGALSKKPLIQKGWRCQIQENDIILPGFTKVKTFNYSLIKDNYDTLVIDCEGAFYYILIDFPEILNNIKLIIIENDFIDIKHKEYVDNLLNKNGLKSIYHMPGGKGPCRNKFYEVFKKF